jgi:hypothetical protein
VELLTCFRSTRQQLIDVAAEHAALAIEIAAGLRDCLLGLLGPEAGDASPATPAAPATGSTRPTSW